MDPTRTVQSYYFSNFCHGLQCDTREQLRNVQQIRVVHYRYTEDFARHAGLPAAVDTGVIAQEVQNILPEAVRTAGDIVLPNGTKLDNFLVVNRVGYVASG